MRDKRIKKLLNHFSAIIPLKAYIRITSQNLLLPFYHNVCNAEEPHTKNLFRTKNEKQFTEDIDYLLKYFVPVDLEQLNESGYKHGKLNNSFWLSFDDGLSGVYDIAAPILLKKGIPFGVFINTNFIDNKDLFYRYKASIIVDKIINSGLSQAALKKIEKEFVNEKLFKKTLIKSILSVRYFNRYILDKTAGIIEVDFKEYLIKNKPYLSSVQIKDLISKGVAIGSHSLDHPRFSDISFKEQLRQTKDSISQIDSNYNQDFRIFSFPFNDIKVKKEYFDTVYKNDIADLTFGSSGLKHEQFERHFHRLSMENPDVSAEKLISTEYLYYMLKMPFGKNIIKRK
jgi:peptidoglycan/xylan/chitin deacetylase (PgdA/CDA1 family)